MKKEVLDSIVFGVAIGVGVSVLQAVIKAYNNRKNKLSRPDVPADGAPWRQVGTLSYITIYPLKSAKGIDLEEAEVTRLGLRQINYLDYKFALRDRYLIIFREDNGEMVTSRTYPTLLHCTLSSESKDTLRLSYPGNQDFILRIPNGSKKITRMWQKEPVECLDCGDEVAIWITQWINKDRKEEEVVKMRLGFWPGGSASRDIVGAWPEMKNLFKGVTNSDGGAFSDLTSYLLVCSSSVDELNRRTDNIKVSHRQFRPNFLIHSDEPPFSELKWKWVKIGDNIFRVVKGCQRCTLTTYDPDTALKLPDNEPLATLNRMEEAKCKEPIEESPMMGIHLGSYEPGTVQIGDPVYIL